MARVTDRCGAALADALGLVVRGFRGVESHAERAVLQSLQAQHMAGHLACRYLLATTLSVADIPG